MVITWNVNFKECPKRFLEKIGNTQELPNLIVIALQNVYQCNKLIETSDSVVDYIKSSWRKLLDAELVSSSGYAALSETFLH